MMGTRVVPILCLAAALCGCSHAPERRPDRVGGVRNDLTGLQAQTVRALMMSYIRDGKVFLYAAQHSDSPIVDKKDVEFALQFRTAPIYGGFKEAEEFNRRMLGYMRGQLRHGICPEHRGVPLQGKTVRRGRLPPSRALVCPVDGRSFVIQ